MASTIRLDVITPSRSAFSDDVNMVIARALDGDVGILPGHVPLVAALDIWSLRIITPNGEQKMAISGGLMSVSDGKIVIMTATAERAEDVDVARSKKALARAEAALESTTDTREIEIWKNTRRRAQVRLSIATVKH
ncbi:MAG: ATP synthase F1 subunit epsilon [Negativicutes bacterium]